MLNRRAHHAERGLAAAREIVTSLLCLARPTCGRWGRPGGERGHRCAGTGVPAASSSPCRAALRAACRPRGNPRPFAGLARPSPNSREGEHGRGSKALAALALQRPHLCPHCIHSSVPARPRPGCSRAGRAAAGRRPQATNLDGRSPSSPLLRGPLPRASYLLSYSFGPSSYF